VDATIRLYAILAERVRAAGMWSLYEEIELPLLPVLTDMEMAGVLLDVEYLHGMSQRLGVRLGELEQQLFQLVGHEFNLRSTQQMSQVLFGELKFPARNIAKTASGHYSTAVFELEKLAAQTDKLSPEQMRVLDLIFEQRQLEKLRGTYVDALPALINPATGRVHTSFNQTGAVTGRMSSSDPNLQNIPVRTELGREIRRAFVAPPGWLLVSADYSQVELRIMAHVAQEETLIAAFLAGQDIHAATAARLFGIPLEEVSKAQRNLAKTINFATIYGSSGFALTARTEMTPGEARAFMDQYLATYPRIRTYIEETKQRAVTDGYVQTLLGRKRFFPELANPRLPFNQRLALERQAINAPIQGTAADIMKLAMVRVHAALRERGLRTRMLLQVHDELVLEAPEDERDAVVELVPAIMADAFSMSVPLKADVEVGTNWRDLEAA
jgi:DNA polymerase-1